MVHFAKGVVFLSHFTTFRLAVGALSGHFRITFGSLLVPRNGPLRKRSGFPQSFHYFSPSRGGTFGTLSDHFWITFGAPEWSTSQKEWFSSVISLLFASPW